MKAPLAVGPRLARWRGATIEVETPERERRLSAVMDWPEVEPVLVISQRKPTRGEVTLR